MLKTKLLLLFSTAEVKLPYYKSLKLVVNRKISKTPPINLFYNVEVNELMKQMK